MIPKFSYYNDIKIGDNLIYYWSAPKMVVLGLFEIIEGPGFYHSEWFDNIQFKIKPIHPIEEENFISYYDLVDKISLFKDEEGNPLSSRSAAMKIIGTIREINSDDFKKVVEMYLGKESPEEIIEIQDSLHITMNKASHLLANTYQCNSFVGTSERKRVYNSIIDEEETQISIPPMEELPSWMSDISRQLKTQKRLLYIDNIWFCEESPGFFIPFAAIEHEKDGNLRTVMDHFVALDKTLKSNAHLKEIDPLYFLVAKDSAQMDSYSSKISEHGEWREFKKSHNFFIVNFEDVKQRTAKFIQPITEHLRLIPFSFRNQS